MPFQKKASHIFDTKRRLLNQDSESVLYNPTRGMKRKELGYLFSSRLFIFYCVMTSTLKVYFMLKIPHYPFPITFNFKQISCPTNSPTGNVVDLQ